MSTQTWQPLKLALHPDGLPWTGRSSLSSIRLWIMFANYWSTAEGGPGWNPSIEGYAIWRTED